MISEAPLFFLYLVTPAPPRLARVPPRVNGSNRVGCSVAQKELADGCSVRFLLLAEGVSFVCRSETGNADLKRLYLKEAVCMSSFPIGLTVQSAAVRITLCVVVPCKCRS